MIKFSGAIILATSSSQNIIFSQARQLSYVVTSDADFDTQRQRLADSSGRAVDAAGQKQCQDTEALLQVKYTLSEDEWNDRLPGIENASHTPRLSIQPSGNYGNSSINHRVGYSNYAALDDYEACIPKEEQGCFQVSIYMLPISSYEISYNNVVMVPTSDHVFYDSYWTDGDTQVQFPVTSTEIGNACYPVCEESEKLFDHYQFNGYWGTINTHQPFRIDEVDSNSNVLNCNRGVCGTTGFSSDQVGLYRYRACLPASTCYSFLVGRQYSLFFDPFSYAVHYNEDLIIERDDILRVSQAYFGGDCKPKCKEEDESTVTFSGLFWSRDCSTSDASRTFTWNISDPGSEEVLTGGAISACGTNGTWQRLFHEVVCVPRGKCTTLKVQSDNNSFDTELHYAITMDDTTYRNTLISGRNFGRPTFNTTFLGNCTQSNCMPEEDLIEISLRTPMEFTQNGINQTAIPSASSFTPGTIDWQVDYADGRFSRYPEQSSRYFVVSAYELDTKFRALMCIPSGDCIYDASISADAPVMDYSVKQNGVHVNTKTRNRFEGSSLDPYLLLVASLGDRCNFSLSGGAIAGIVIASIVVFVAVVGGVYLLHKKNQQQH